MTDIERPQIKRLADNIRIMDDAAAGKGKYFIQPDTAKEIAKDLRDFEQRLWKEKGAAEFACLAGADPALKDAMLY